MPSRSEWRGYGGYVFQANAIERGGIGGASRQIVERIGNIPTIQRVGQRLFPGFPDGPQRRLGGLHEDLV